MALIELSGKHAIGRHRFAQVDDVDVALVGRWKWKAKPNGAGNYVYAVRNTLIGGRNVTLRMHRVVLGLDPSDTLEVDHLNHDSLDNRRSNLRAVTRRDNNRNRRRRTLVYTCAECGTECAVLRNSLRDKRRLCSACKKRSIAAAYVPTQTVLLLQCATCFSGMTSQWQRRRYCSDACRSRARRLPAPPSPSERLIAAMSAPGTARELACRAGVNESDARRILARLVRDGAITHGDKRKGDKGWASIVYVRVA